MVDIAIEKSHHKNYIVHFGCDHVTCFPTSAADSSRSTRAWLSCTVRDGLYSSTSRASRRTPIFQIDLLQPRFSERTARPPLSRAYVPKTRRKTYHLPVAMAFTSPSLRSKRERVARARNCTDLSRKGSGLLLDWCNWHCSHVALSVLLP